MKNVIHLVKERADFVKDIWDHANFFFVAPEEYDQQVIKKRWNRETPDLLITLLKILESISPFDAPEIENQVKKWMEANQIHAGQLMTAWRLALVGTTKGPAIFDITALLGYNEVKKRIKQAIEKIELY